MNSRPVITGIAHVQVAITPGEEDRARAFYGGLLGLAEIPKPSTLTDRGGCWFACGAQEIHCGVEEAVVPTRRHPALSVRGLEFLEPEGQTAPTPTEEDHGSE